MAKNPSTDAPPASARPTRRRPIGRVLGVTAFSIVAGVVVLALVAAGLGWFTVQRSFPQLDGTIAAPGLHAEVDVLRDDLGVPTILADDAHDLFFAQGYVSAQDRFWEMDFRRHVTSGRLAEMFGESQLGTDRFLRTLGWRHVADQEVKLIDPTVRSWYESYAEGVNAYLASADGADVSLEYAVLALQNPGYEIEPWTPGDSVAWLKAMAWDLRDNLDAETERAAVLAAGGTAEEVAELYPGYPFEQNPVIAAEITPDPPAVATPLGGGTDASTARAAMSTVPWAELGDVIAEAGALLGDAGEGIGSNSWVVSGDLTESGLPLLANDPHLGADLPSVWQQFGLRCREVTEECPFDVTGFGFSGVPGVVIGHNDQVAWGFTNLTTDVADLYVERLQGDEYWRDGALVPLEVRTETLEIAGGEPEELVIRSTVHGPIISGLAEPYTSIAGASPPADGAVPEGESAVSLRWTALDPGLAAESVFALDLSRSFGEFREAATVFDVPAQNLVYADVDGNIGYQTPGRLPVRGAGDGSVPQPGWDSAYDWTGFIPFEELPVLYNPPEGVIVTANNAVVGPDYPYFLTNDWDYGWRAARISELLDDRLADGRVTLADMGAIQADAYSPPGAMLAKAYDALVVDDDAARAGLALLSDWDAQATADSAAAAYANVLWDELLQDLLVRGREHPYPLGNQGRLILVVQRLLDEPDSPWWTNAELGVSGRDELLAAAATGAVERLTALQGADPRGWNWGDLHALTLRTGTFGSSGIAPLEWAFNRGPFPVGGGSSIVDATGWDVGGDFTTVTVPSMRMLVDLADLDASRWNNLTGQSGHAFHPNYIDQVDDWQHVRTTPWPFSDRALRAAATHTLRLTP